MKLCTANCYSDSKAATSSVNRCVESCLKDVLKAQEYIQSEVNQSKILLLQDVFVCQDRIKGKIRPNPTETEINYLRGEFDECSIQCIERYIGQLPTLMEKIKKDLNL